MKKLLALASAISVMALASGANAQSSASLTLSGTVAPTFSITSASNLAAGTSGTINDNSSSATARLVNLGTNGNFASGGAVASTGFEGTTTFSMTANTPFTAKITSANGGLQNSTTPASVIAYSIGFDSDVNLYDAGAAPTKFYVNNPAVSSVGVHYKVTANAKDKNSAALVTGQYADILQLTFTAQ